MTALGIRLLFEKVRQRTNYFDCMVAEEFRQILFTRFEYYGEIVPHNDVCSESTRFRDEITKRRIQLGRATRDVQCGNAKPTHGSDNGLRCFTRHDLRSLRTCVDMAMLACLITKLAHIDLQGIDGRRS